jgi:hypothetical protein
MDPLVLLSRVEDIEILREVASALNCLSSVEENKAEVADRAACTIIGLDLFKASASYVTHVLLYALIKLPSIFVSSLVLFNLELLS